MEKNLSMAEVKSAIYKLGAENQEDLQEITYYAFEHMLNNLNGEKDKLFIEKITNSHRTLQQTAMRTFLSICQQWAKDYQQGYYDGRNEKALKFADQIIKLAKEKEVYLPVI